MSQVFYFDGPNEEWKTLRRQYITATEAASCFQIGNKSIAAIAQEKIEPVEFQKNEYMLIGNILEPSVLKAFELRMGINAQPAHPSKIVFVTHDTTRLAATPDGKYICDEGKFHLIECKTTGSKDPIKARQNFEKWRTEVPKHYALQVHTQMVVTGARHAFIGCMAYNYPLPFIAYAIHHDPRIEELLLEEVDRFWNCFDNNKVFHINSTKKKEMISLLKSTEELVYVSHGPTENETGII